MACSQAQICGCNWGRQRGDPLPRLRRTVGKLTSGKTMTTGTCHLLSTQTWGPPLDLCDDNLGLSKGGLIWGHARRDLSSPRHPSDSPASLSLPLPRGRCPDGFMWNQIRDEGTGRGVRPACQIAEKQFPQENEAILLQRHYSAKPCCALRLLIYKYFSL